jgi:hypothetical protein
MQHHLRCPLLLFLRNLTLPATSKGGDPLSIEVELAHDSQAEKRTRDHLLGLLARFDLSRWQFTDRVVIDERAIPHSHPVLTLHTRHEDDVLLLSTYLHEQLHWFITAQPDERIVPVIKALEDRYPAVPVGFPIGPDDPLSSYFHFMICYLEWKSLAELVGADRARQAMDFWARDHYTEIYATVLRDGDFIRELVERYRLLPGSSAGQEYFRDR